MKIVLTITCILTFFISANSFASIKDVQLNKSSIAKFCKTNGLAEQSCHKNGIVELTKIIQSSSYLLNYKDESFLKAAKEQYDIALMELCQENYSGLQKAKLVCVPSDIFKLL